MIKKLLRAIRQKPKAVREQYAFWIACVLTSVVAASWLTVTLGGFNVGALSNDYGETVPAPDSLSDFLKDTQEQFTSVQEEIQNLPPAVQSVSSSTESGVQNSVSASSTPVIAAPPVTARQEVRIATTSTASQEVGPMNQ